MRFRKSSSLAIAAVIAAGGLLSACNDDDSSSSADTSSPSQSASAPTSSPTTDPAVTDSPSPTTSDSSTGGSGGAKGSPVKVNKSFTDDVMGEKATAISYIAGFQPSAAAKAKFSALADEQVVLVNVKVTASTKYYDSFGATSFYLTGMSNGIDAASTTILDDDIKAAGYPPLEDAETGKTTTGWVVFTPSKDTTKLTLRYRRLAAKTSDGTKITAKNFDIPLN